MNVLSVRTVDHVPPLDIFKKDAVETIHTISLARYTRPNYSGIQMCCATQHCRVRQGHSRRNVIFIVLFFTEVRLPNAAYNYLERQTKQWDNESIYNTSKFCLLIVKIIIFS